jgi:two-component system, NtrC family, sensor kinase
MGDRNATVLVVDDAPDEILILEDLLAEQYAVETAADGREALGYLDAGGAADLILTDAMMPGMDGFELCGRLKKIPRLTDIPVIFLTSLEDWTDEERALSMGAVDFIHKPVSPPVALARVRNHLELARMARMLRAKNRRLKREHTKAEESLRLEEAALQATPNAVMITDRDANIVWINPAFTRVTGYETEEVLGRNPRILKSGELSPTFYADLWGTIASGQRWEGELINRRKDGRALVEEATITPVCNAGGGITHFVAVMQDVTDRKEAEQQRTMMEIQLRQAQKLESIGQLAAGIAHEINTPTQYIGDNARFLQEAFSDRQQVWELFLKLLQAAKEGAVPDELVQEIQDQMTEADTDYLASEIPQAIEHTLEGVERVAKIVRAMKNFSHPGSEEKTPIDLNKAIENTLTVSRNEWKYHADLVADLDPALPPVPCLPGELNQVILNLVVNAAHAIADVVGDASGCKGTLAVSTRLDGAWAEIRVEDTGSGIPEHARDRIFDPFFTTKGVGKGTGQGLAISHSVIVDKHGGTIHFETETGGGTSFIVRLPLDEVKDNRGKASS